MVLNLTSKQMLTGKEKDTGVFSKECDAFLDMLSDLGFDDRHRKYCIRKIMSIAIRATYYIFCCRNKDWSTPELLAI